MGLMEGKVMKKSSLFFAAVAALSLLASCAREDDAPAGSDNAAGNVQTLTACFDPENNNVFYFFDFRYTLKKVTISN